MDITYANKYDVKIIYDTFKKNRVNKISYLGTSNNGDSSAYLSYVNNSTDTYIYARKSSPIINSDTYKNYAYLKVNDTTYNFYRGHAYTYTETVSGQNIKPILIAYDFVNQISTQLKFNNVSVSHNATAINDIPQTVNVFSPVSYIIENGGKSKGPKNEYSISKDEINALLGGSTFADFTTYVTYSYLDPTKYDGKVYEDGKDKLSSNSTDPINDIHVWSLSDGIDMTEHAYVNNDTTAVNAYTYLNCGNILNTFFRNNYSNIFDYTSNDYKYIKFYYDTNSSVTNGLHQQWKAGIEGTDKIYAKDLSTDNNKLNYSKFYQVCKVEKDNVSSFDEIYNKPSLRNNSDKINCYININGESNSSNNQESLFINEANKNFARYIKRITNLPISIVGNNTSNTWFWKFELPAASNQSGTTPTKAPSSGGVDYNTGGATVVSHINIYSGGKFTIDGNKLILSYNESDYIQIRISLTFETVNGNSISDYSQALVSVNGASKYVSLESIGRQYTVNFTEDFINKPFNVIHIQQYRTNFDVLNGGQRTACINIGHGDNENIWYTTTHPASRSMYDLVYSNSSNIKVTYNQNEYDVRWGLPFVGGGDNPINCIAHLIN